MFRKICNLVIIVIVLGSLAILAILGVPLLQGKQMYAVLTASMEPTHPEGSIVVVDKADPQTIQENDVITFGLDGFDVVITHRVIGIDSEQQWFYTKGDNNAAADFAPVPFANLIGKVDYGVPRLGAFVANIRTPGGILVIIWVVLIVVLMLVLPDLVDRIRESGKEKRRAQREVWRREHQQQPARAAAGTTAPSAPNVPEGAQRPADSWQYKSLHSPSGGEPHEE